MKDVTKEHVPQVSVLMSVYNPKKEDQLLQAVNSIIWQTFSDWEMILYDDGSDEPYRILIERAAGLDDRIRYVRGEKNRGLAYAMNLCIEQTRAPYIARMDGDDISSPARLEKQLAYLKQHNEVSWAGCNVSLINGHGCWGSRIMPENPAPEDFLQYSPYVHPAVMFRREVLTENGGYHISQRGEDYELFMRLHAEGYCGCNIQERLFAYREDKDTYRHRKLRYQFEEVGIRLRGFRLLHILRPRTIPYVIKPLIVAVIPYRLLVNLKIRLRKEIYVEGFKGKQMQQI